MLSKATPFFFYTIYKILYKVVDRMHIKFYNQSIEIFLRGVRMKIRKEIAAYVPMADMLLATFGEDVEVVLHDLAAPEHSVIYVAGNVTGRRRGQSFDHLVHEAVISGHDSKDYVANYFFTADNGKRIRSSSILIRDEVGRPAGAMCINLDTTRIAAAAECLRSLLLQPRYPKVEASAPDESTLEHDGTNVSDMVVSLIDNILSGCSPEKLTRDERIAKIRFMEEKGIFELKSSIGHVAERMGISKVTVYSYLDEVRGKRR